MEADGLALPLGVSVRERILDAAYELFARSGIRGVDLDKVGGKANVPRAELSQHFPTKDELVLAFLERREAVWTKQFVAAEARRRGSTPEERLLAIFDIFDDWFQREDFEGCSFINVMFEMHDDPTARAACIHYLENIRETVCGFAEEAGLRDPSAFAYSWHILMKGAIVQAAEGDLHAAKRAKALASMLIDAYRPVDPHAA